MEKLRNVSDRSFIFVVFSKYYYSDQIKENKLMGHVACSGETSNMCIILI